MPPPRIPTPNHLSDVREKVFDKPATAAAAPAAPAAGEGEKKKEGGGKPTGEETNPILHRIQEAVLQVSTREAFQRVGGVIC